MFKANRVLSIIALFFFVVIMGSCGGGGGGSLVQDITYAEGVTDVDGEVSFNIGDRIVSFKIIDSEGGAPLEGASVYIVSDGNSVLVFDPLSGYFPTIAQIDNIQSLQYQVPLISTTTTLVQDRGGMITQATVKQPLLSRLLKKLNIGGSTELLGVGLTLDKARELIIKDSRKLTEDDIMKSVVTLIFSLPLTAEKVVSKIGFSLLQDNLLPLNVFFDTLEINEPNCLYTVSKLKDGILSLNPLRSYVIEQKECYLNVDFMTGDGKVKGVVTVDGIHAPGVVVKAYQPFGYAREREVQTDSQGFYSIDRLRDGRWNVEFVYPSAAWSSIEVINIEGSETVTLDKNLQGFDLLLGLKVFPRDVLIPSSSSTYIDLKNYSILPLSWQVSGIPPWLNVTPTNGQLSMFGTSQIKLSVGSIRESTDATIIFTSSYGDTVLVKVSAVPTTVWTDTDPPSIPTDLIATAVSSTQIDLSWSASTDNVGVTGYNVYRGVAYLKSVTTTSASDSGLSASTSYCYTVSAYDAAGNESGKSSKVCATTLSIPVTTSPSQGTISGSVKDAVTRSPLQGASINVYSGSSIISSGATDSNGVYSFSVPAGSGYRVEFSKTGYIPAIYENVSVEADTTTYLEVVLQIDTTHSGTGNISGKIVNALDGTGVSGLTINLRAGINVTTGSIVATTTTLSNGFYSFTNLNAGNYTAEVSGSGYNTTYFTVICIGGTTTADQNVTITPILYPGETRIILTWGEIPWDLDSHLTGPLPDGTRFHMYYPYAESRGGSHWPEYVKLDLDDVTSYGPETTTIYQQIDGVYRFSVHDYTNRYSSSSTALSNSGAQVRVYRGSNLVATFNVPANQEGTLWTVFELSGDTITPINTMSYESSPSAIQSVSLRRTITTDVELIRNLPPKR